MAVLRGFESRGKGGMVQVKKRNASKYFPIRCIIRAMHLEISLSKLYIELGELNYSLKNSALPVF